MDGGLISGKITALPNFTNIIIRQQKVQMKYPAGVGELLAVRGELPHSGTRCRILVVHIMNVLNVTNGKF